MSANCPTCGRPYPKPKAVKGTAAIDLTAMTDAQRRAYYAKTAPVEDARFALRIGLELSAELRADWEAHVHLAPSLTRTEAMRRLLRLQERWRKEVQAAEQPWPGIDDLPYMRGATAISEAQNWDRLHHPDGRYR